ncbi:CPBP family intramembrane glutamic endopeptidase [Colwellia sp. MEBiC06753]
MDDVKKVPKTAPRKLMQAKIPMEPSSPSLIVTGFWALVLFFVPTTLAGLGFGVYAEYQEIADVRAWFRQVETMMVMTFSIYFIVFPSLLLLAKYIGDGSSIKEYLKLSPQPMLLWLKVILLSMAFWGGFTLLSFIIDLPEEPFMQQIRNSSLPIWFICLNICVFAPVVEELTFRGFLFARLVQTKLKLTGAVLITSALFAVIHSQYSMLGVLMVFVLGLYFAWVRAFFNSTGLSIVAHMTCNILSMVALFTFT